LSDVGKTEGRTTEVAACSSFPYRLGASALMQGLADGYFVVPYTLANYLGGQKLDKVTTDHEAFREAEASLDARITGLMKVNGDKSVKEYHRSLGRILWDHVGMARNRAGLQGALEEVTALRAEYQQNVRVVGPGDNVNKQLEYALRVDDYMEFADIVVCDALDREESCGCHFREEYQTEDGECLRNDEEFAYAAAWEFKVRDATPELHKEQLEFKSIDLKQRNYKCGWGHEHRIHDRQSSRVAPAEPRRARASGGLHRSRRCRRHVLRRDARRPE